MQKFYFLFLIYYFFVLAKYGLLAVGAYGYNRYGYAYLLFNVFYIVAERSGKVFVATSRGYVGEPAWDCFVDRFYICRAFGVASYAVGEVFCYGTVGEAVGCAHLDFLERVEHVALHHYEVCGAVYHHGVAQSHKVEPSASAFASCHGTVFMSYRADFFAGGVEQLCGEGAAANAGAVSLEYAVDASYASGGYAKAGTCAGCYGVARCDEGIGAEVYV